MRFAVPARVRSRSSVLERKVRRREPMRGDRGDSREDQHFQRLLVSAYPKGTPRCVHWFPIYALGVRLNTWTGLCCDSQALPLFERAESA